MADILLEIVTPANGKSYDFSVDDAVLIMDAVRKIYTEVLEFEKNIISYKAEDTLLVNPETGPYFDITLSLCEADIRSGQKLMII